MWIVPAASLSTISCLTSTPRTRRPRLAITQAVGRPMYPSPNTVTERYSSPLRAAGDVDICDQSVLLSIIDLILVAGVRRSMRPHGVVYGEAGTFSANLSV